VKLNTVVPTYYITNKWSLNKYDPLLLYNGMNLILQKILEEPVCFYQDISQEIVSWHNLLSGLNNDSMHQTVAAGTEVLAAVGVKTTVFWDEVLCNQDDIHKCSGWTYCPHIHGWRVSQASSKLNAEYPHHRG
jgi:hypothetical protein